MTLFRCETFYHLINAINIKMMLLKDEEADLVLTHSCDFSNIIPKIEKKGIFANVFYSKEYWKDSVELNEKASTKRSSMTKDPASFLYDEPWLKKQYDTIYIPTLTASYFYLAYFSFCRRFGNSPKIYLFEDGTDTYSRNNNNIIKIRSGICTDISKVPSEFRFENNYAGVLVYEPELCQHSNEIPIMSIPKMTDSVYETLKEVFGWEALPSEKYIYFSEPFHDEFINNNEMQLLDRIADKVGKENIIVKLHPRSTFEQFSDKGYKLMKNVSVPWEIIAADKNVEQKIIMAVSSTTILSPMFIHDYDTKAIMLMDLITKNRVFTSTPEFKVLKNSLFRHFNRDSRKLFIPGSFLELDMAIDYYMMILEENDG